jgi:hypothetical protein
MDTPTYVSPSSSPSSFITDNPLQPSQSRMNFLNDSYSAPSPRIITTTPSQATYDSSFEQLLLKSLNTTTSPSPSYKNLYSSATDFFSPSIST